MWLLHFGLTPIKTNTFLSICLIRVSVSQKLLNTKGVRAAVYFLLQSLQIKTLSNPAPEKFANQWITQRNDSSRRLNLPYALERGVSSSVRKGGHLSQKRVQLEGLAHGAVRDEWTASQEPGVGTPASLPDSLMSKVWSGSKSPELGPRKLVLKSQLLSDVQPSPILSLGCLICKWA